MMIWLILGCSVQQEECSPLYYENFGAGFLTEHCQGCHGRETSEREGAPANIVFDQKEDVLEHLALIQKEMEEDTMPPAGGLTDQEYEAFIEWLGCVEQQ